MLYIIPSFLSRGPYLIYLDLSSSSPPLTAPAALASAAPSAPSAPSAAPLFRSPGIDGIDGIAGIEGIDGIAIAGIDGIEALPNHPLALPNQPLQRRDGKSVSYSCSRKEILLGRLRSNHECQTDRLTINLCCNLTNAHCLLCCCCCSQAVSIISMYIHIMYYMSNNERAHQLDRRSQRHFTQAQNTYWQGVATAVLQVFQICNKMLTRSLRFDLRKHIK